MPIPVDARDALVGVESGAGVEAWRDGDAIIVRANYVAGDETLTLTCDSGVIAVPITVEPLVFEPLLAWDASTTAAPAGREYFAWWMADGGENAIYLYGGFVYEPKQYTPSQELWRFDLGTTTWSAVAQTGEPPPPGGRVAPTGVPGQRYYHGGTLLGADGSLDTPHVLRTLTLNTDGSAAWSRVESEKTAPSSYTGGLIYDAPRSRLISFCGADSRVYGLNCEVFEMIAPQDGFMNLQLDSDIPDPRFGFQYVHDVVNTRVVMFAGQNGNANLAQAGDTWSLELVPEADPSKPRWVRLFESTDGVSKRRNAADAYDPVGRRMFVWGGTADGATAIGGLEVLNLDRGHERWTHVELPANVPPRASGGGVYDPIGRRVVWGFGNSNEGVYTDLYELRL